MPPGSCSSPSLQQQQGPPPPYMPPSGNKPPSAGKLQKAPMPEKYESNKLNKSGNASPHPSGSNSNLQMLDTSNSGGGEMMFGGGPGRSKTPSIATSGLQTTPSPQLMNYIEFEGQELTITKQLNLSFKGNCEPNDLMLDQKPPPLQPPPLPSSQNSAILNCLNSNNNNSNPNNNNNNSPVINQQQQGPPQLNEQEEMKIKNEILDHGQMGEPQMNFGGPNNNTSSPLGILYKPLVHFC